MTLRSSLLSLALAGTLVPGLAAAQSITGRVPATSAATLTLGDAPAAPAPASRLLAGCTAGQTVTQAFVSMQTFNVPAGNTAGTGGAPQEFGQSYIAPCDGIQTAFAFVGVASVANQVVAGTLTVYAGSGTAGTPLAAVPFSFTLPSATGYNLPLGIADAFVVTQGQTYTAFVDLNTSTDAFRMQLVRPGTYLDGALFFSATGGPDGAIPDDPTTGDDLIFTSTFGPAVTVTTPVVYNGPGYRLLSTPVSGVSTSELAALNLVQQVPAGAPAAVYPAQYPTAPGARSNLLTFYNGTGFFGPSSTAYLPQSGRGFFWYWYDQAITPDPASFGGGTSTSRELSGYTLSATGGAVTANLSRVVLLNANGAYMLGNPFVDPFQLSGLTVSATGGALSTVFSVYDPAAGNGAGSYLTLAPTDYVAPWQGFFAQTTGGTANPAFTYAITSSSPTPTPPFYGRGAADAGVRFQLAGTTVAGVTADLAAQVRFLDDALVGEDRHDGSKLLPPGDVYALLAPVGEYNGAPARLSVNSLPEAVTDATVALAFTATNAGTFTMTWENTLAAGQTATLYDAVEHATVDLATAAEYTFTSDATDWTERFTLTFGRGAVAGEATPTALRVGTFAPNPAAGTSRLTFTADAAQAVRATVVDALGRTVAVLFDGSVAAGSETAVTVEAGRLAPGTYVVRVAGETFAETRRLTVVR